MVDKVLSSLIVASLINSINVSNNGNLEIIIKKRFLKLQTCEKLLTLIGPFLVIGSGVQTINQS